MFTPTFNQCNQLKMRILITAIAELIVTPTSGAWLLDGYE